MKDILDSPIEFLKGVGPQRGELLNKELRIFTFRDLLHYFPFRYIDKSEINTVRQIPEMDGYVQLRGTIRNVKKSGIGRNKRLSAIFADETGSIELTWFAGINYVEGNLYPNRPVLVYGKPKYYGAAWNIPHPEIADSCLSEYGKGISKRTTCQRNCQNRREFIGTNSRLCFSRSLSAKTVARKSIAF
jgi:ATP-dependent DNA helicase RecG